MRYAWLIALAVVATTGCNQAELKKALSEAKAAEAQKDSLLTEVLETTQFVSDVNSELAKAKTVATKPASTDPGVPGAKKDREERVAALERVKTVIAKLNESEAKLAATESRQAPGPDRDLQEESRGPPHHRRAAEDRVRGGAGREGHPDRHAGGPGGHAQQREGAARER